MKAYPRYPTVQIVVHWLTALFVLITILLPLMKNQLAETLGGMGTLFVLHKSLGIIVFFITLWRIYLIIKKGLPKVLPQNEKLQRILSKSVQGIIYILLLLLPLSGYLMGSRSLSFFNILTIPSVSLPDSVRSVFHSIHIVSAYLIIALITLHILAAIYHHYWVKDDVMKSMLPRKWFC